MLIAARYVAEQHSAAPLFSAGSASASSGPVRVDAGELELPFAWAAGTDPLDTATMAAIAAGVSMRRYASTLEELPPPEQALSVSKSATSRRFVALSEEQLLQWLSPLAGQAGPAGRDGRRHPLRDRVILLALALMPRGTSTCWGCAKAPPSTRVVRSLLTI